MKTTSIAFPVATLRRAALAMAIPLFAACGGDDTVEPAAVATTIAVTTTTDAQTATVGQQTASALSVVVKDQNGNVISDVPVTWTVVSGGGSVGSATSKTDNNGMATTTFTVGTTAGNNVVSATLANGASASFSATGKAAAVSTLTVASGNNQSVVAGTTSAPMMVTAKDQYGNPVSGASVTWTTSGGTLSSSTATTNAAGQASVSLATALLAGVYSVNAAVGSVTTSFSVTGT